MQIKGRIAALEDEKLEGARERAALQSRVDRAQAEINEATARAQVARAHCARAV